MSDQLSFQQRPFEAVGKIPSQRHPGAHLETLTGTQEDIGGMR
jgi:hypothetical protein